MLPIFLLHNIIIDELHGLRFFFFIGTDPLLPISQAKIRLEKDVPLFYRHLLAFSYMASFQALAMSVVIGGLFTSSLFTGW